MEEQKKSNGVMWAVVVVVLALIAYGGYKYTKKDSSAVMTSEVTTLPESPVESNFTYKSGTYSAIGNYNSPGGAEEIDVKIILEDDVVVDAEVISKATRPRSVTMQGKFISGYEALVVGKKLDEVLLDKVSGSSLTPKGFNEAIEEIKLQAKA